MERKITIRAIEKSDHNMTLGDIIHCHAAGVTDLIVYTHQNMKLKRLMGFILPPFQRPLVWTDEQKIRFIESIWLGYHIGTYVVNSHKWIDKDTPHPYDYLLLDGQQRIATIRDYVNDEFPVFGYLYSELTIVDVRKFKSTVFIRSTVNLKTDEELRELYNRLNFGGTAHTEEQRA